MLLLQDLTTWTAAADEEMRRDDEQVNVAAMTLLEVEHRLLGGAERRAQRLALLQVVAVMTECLQHTQLLRKTSQVSRGLLRASVEDNSQLLPVQQSAQYPYWVYDVFLLANIYQLWLKVKGHVRTFPPVCVQVVDFMVSLLQRASVGLDVAPGLGPGNPVETQTLSMGMGLIATLLSGPQVLKTGVLR